MQKRTDLVVFDLDGTIIRCNSFHLWIGFCIFSHCSALNLKKKLKIIFNCLLRILKRIDHAQFKKEVMLIKPISSDRMARYFLKNLIIPKISFVCYKEMLLWKKKGVTIVIATAAAETYVEAIAKYFGIKHWVSSYLLNDKLFNCIGKNKIHSLRRKFNNFRILALYTDHIDDLPLMSLANYVILVNPKETQKKKILSKLSNEYIKIIKDK